MNLPNGCSVFEVNIFPPNWNTRKADISLVWYINFYFRDPRYLNQFLNGKYVFKKSGLNRLKTLYEKQRTIAMMRKVMVEQLENGYNPFDKSGPVIIKIAPIVRAEPEVIIQVIPSTPFIKAFRFSLTRSSNVKETLKDTESALRKLEAAA